MKEFTLERNPMDVNSVGKYLYEQILSEGMTELNLERKPTDISNFK
jgi:hypothetical protein